MVHAPRLSPAQRRLHAETDEGSVTLAEVLMGRSVIERGDDGSAVRFIQRLLNEFGHGLAPDGDFGPLTENAVERYQRAHGLDDDGVVGRRTLRSLLRNQREEEYRLLRIGSRGKDVREMEENLRRLGYLEREEVDGVYDGETAKAIHKFRADQPQIRDTNEGRFAGSPTQKLLEKEVAQLRHDPRAIRIRRNEAHGDLDMETARAIRENGPIMRDDERTGLVRNVQRHLKAAGYDPENTGGNFDERTEAALRHFQRRSDLPATGQVDEATWKKLHRSMIQADGPTDPPQRMGERSRAVLRSERLLDRAGYDPGRVDGLFDADTRRALKRFERDHPRAGDADSIGPRQLREITREARRPKFIKPIDARLTSISEFNVPDAEGAPSSRGGRFHAGKDWFGPGGSLVRSPIEGRIVEVTPSRGNSGQVFGGTVKVQGEDGKVWVFRHVNPGNVRVGERVDAGDPIARITTWRDGPSHAHIELWKTLSGGYRFENMIDPMRYLSRFL